MAAQDQAEKTVFNLVHVMSEQVERTIQSVDFNLQDIAREIQKNPDLRDDDPDFRNGLHKRLAALPYVRALFVIGADGYISHDTDFPSTPKVSLADRDYFRGHRLDAANQLHISGPLKSRSVGTWFVSATRRINAPNGDFRGVVVAAVEPLYFERFYRRMWMGGGTIALCLENGTLLARSPVDERVMGTSFSGREPFRTLLPTHSQGVFWAESTIDGVYRVVGYQHLASLPIVVVMTLNESDVMLAWRSHATVAVVGAAILLCLLLFLEWLARHARCREELARLRLAQAQKLEAIGRFAGGIAHDIGNLMRIVRSGVTVLRPKMEGQHDALKVLHEIERSLDDGREMLNRLLAQARSTEIRLEPVDLNQTVLDFLPVLEQAGGPTVNIVAAFPTAKAICLIDKVEFRSSLVNLVLNARDSMPSGGTVTIELSFPEEQRVNGNDRWIDVNVSDEGVGMTEKVRRHAFDPFFTTKPPGYGNGVGLSQVADFAHQSGGLVEILSREKKGTKIKIRLPIK